MGCGTAVRLAALGNDRLRCDRFSKVISGTFGLEGSKFRQLKHGMSPTKVIRIPSLRHETAFRKTDWRHCRARALRSMQDQLVLRGRLVLVRVLLCSKRGFDMPERFSPNSWLALKKYPARDCLLIQPRLLDSGPMNLR